MAKNQAVDFDNPDAMAEELAAAEAAEATTEGKPKVKKPRIIKVSFTADRPIAAGEVVEFDYEIPVGQGTRGMLTGIALEDMTDDQLKIEYRNAHSVWYKQKKAGKLTDKATERLDKVKTMMESKGIAPTARGTQVVDAAAVAAMIKSGTLSVEDIQKLLDS